MELYIKRAKKGDIEAFVNLMEMNKTSMYKAAKSILNNDEDIYKKLYYPVIKILKILKRLNILKLGWLGYL